MSLPDNVVQFPQIAGRQARRSHKKKATVLRLTDFNRPYRSQSIPDAQQEKTVSQLLRELAFSLGIRDQFDQRVYECCRADGDEPS